MVAESLPVLPPPAHSVLSCDPTELRLAANALYVAEIALVGTGDAPGEAVDRAPITVVCESGEHAERTADVADLAISAGLGLVRLLVPALRIDVGDEGVDGAGDGADAAGEQELVVTTGAQIHLIRIVPGAAEPRVVYLVLDRARSTVVQARHALRRHLVAGAPAGRPARPEAAAPDTVPLAPVIALGRRAPRRRTTSLQAAGRPVHRGAELGRADLPAAARQTTSAGGVVTALHGGASREPVAHPVPPPTWTHRALPGGSRWSRDDDTLQRVLAGLHGMA